MKHIPIFILLFIFFVAGFSYSQNHTKSGSVEDTISADSKQHTIRTEHKIRDDKTIGEEHLKKDYVAPQTTIFNLVCPVMGNKVNSKANTVVYKEKTFGFCCNGCDRKFKNDPEKYLGNLSEDGTKFIGD